MNPPHAGKTFESAHISYRVELATFIISVILLKYKSLPLGRCKELNNSFLFCPVGWESALTISLNILSACVCPKCIRFKLLFQLGLGTLFTLTIQSFVRRLNQKVKNTVELLTEQSPLPRTHSRCLKIVGKGRQSDCVVVGGL